MFNGDDGRNVIMDLGVKTTKSHSVKRAVIYSIWVIYNVIFEAMCAKTYSCDFRIYQVFYYFMCSRLLIICDR